jgi:UDP-N-acetylmuramate dehydrogenase
MSHTDSADSAEFVAGYPLKAHNTFGFDVRSQWACRIEREAQLLAAVRDPRAAGYRVSCSAAAAMSC